MCAATADNPSAPTSTGSTPSGSGTRSASATATVADMLPSPGRMPAVVGNQNDRPSCVPTPCTPGTYGVAGTPKYDVPLAHSRSSGVIGAAVTSTRTSPAPGVGVVHLTSCGGSPGECNDNAQLMPAPCPTLRPPCPTLSPWQRTDRPFCSRDPARKSHSCRSSLRKRHSCRDVRVRQRVVRQLAGVLQLEAQRLGVVTLEHGDKEGERQERVGAQLEQSRVVVGGQCGALVVLELQPRGRLAQVAGEDPVGLAGFPPLDRPLWIIAVALHQVRVAVDGEQELVQEILAHAGTPLGYQVKYASIVWKRSYVST